MQENIVLFSINKDELSSIIKDAVHLELSQIKEKDLMNFNETCEFLGISVSTLNAWKAQDRVPYKRLGKRIFFKRSDVMLALKDSKYKKLEQIKRDV